MTLVCIRNPEIQKSRNPENQKSRNPEIQKSRNPEIQKSRNPEIQRSRNPEICFFKASRRIAVYATSNLERVQLLHLEHSTAALPTCPAKVPQEPK
jgi:hypothetical protein